MKRREAIKTLMFASGGILALPSWATKWRISDIPNHSPKFTETELKLISSITDTIIPSNGNIGALSVGVDKFLEGLISECYDDDFRKSVKENLHLLNQSAQKTQEISFYECDQGTREQLFLAMIPPETDEENEDNKPSFFGFMKSQTIRGFETSEEVMVNYHHYELMPGYYDGCADVDS